MNEGKKPQDRQYGKHTFKGVRYDRNGNPIYTSDTLSDEEKKSMGWRYSKKHGLHGQISDPSKFNESTKRIVKLTESDLHNIVMESVNRILEGSVVNNKPRFGTVPGKVSDTYDDDAEEFANYLYPEPEEEEKRNKTIKQFQMGQLHNKRAREKYDSEGNPTWGEKGDAIRATKMQNDRKQDVKDIKSMLYYNDIDYQTYKTLSDEEKRECWDTFNYYKRSPLAQRKLEWDRMGDPDWSLTW